MCNIKRVTYRKQRLGCQTSCFCIQVIFTAHGVMVYLNTQLKLAHMWTQFCNPLVLIDRSVLQLIGYKALLMHGNLRRPNSSKNDQIRLW